MWLQIRLSPQATGNSEAEKIQKPCLNFSIDTYHYISWFASGLVLYWTATNLLTILQQWYLNKTIQY